MKVLILNDTHAGVRNNSTSHMDYQERFYSEVLFPYMDEHGIKDILHLGDYNDSSKSVNVLAAHRNREMFIEPMMKRDIKMTIIAGNHDIFYRNSSEVCSLDMIFAYNPNVTILKNATLHTFRGTSYMVLLLPWISREKLVERNTGLVSTIQSGDSGTIRRIFGHQEFNGFHMHKGSIPFSHGDNIEDWFGSYPRDRIHMGHFHSRNGVYLGAQMEFTWADCDDQKGFNVLDTEADTLTFVPNPIRLFERVAFRKDTMTEHMSADYSRKHVRIITDLPHEDPDFSKFHEHVIGQSPYSLEVIRSMPAHIPVPVNEELDATVHLDPRDKILKKLQGHPDHDPDHDKLFHSIWQEITQ